MESLKAIFIVGVFSLTVTLMVSGEKDYTRRPAVHEMRDAIHQVGYNSASRPSREPNYNYGLAYGRPMESTRTTTMTPPPQQNGDVKTLDRFYRVSPDGTVEFKLALSDGQINHQKIYNKMVDDRIVQVYDGYYSVRSMDGEYRTTYYRADEMGYRVLGVIVDTKPPGDGNGHRFV